VTGLLVSVVVRRISLQPQLICWRSDIQLEKAWPAAFSNNVINGAGLVFFRRGPYSVIHAHYECQRDNLLIVDADSARRLDNMSSFLTPLIWRLIGEQHNTRIPLFSTAIRGGAESFLFLGESLTEILPRWYVKFRPESYFRNRVANIFHSEKKMEACRNCSCPDRGLFEVQSRNDGTISPGLRFGDLYPRATGSFQLLLSGAGLGLHFAPHFVRESSIDCETEEGENFNNKRRYWKAFAATLTGFLFVGWGWWRIRFKWHGVQSSMLLPL
jgi:hypothetical protein